MPPWGLSPAIWLKKQPGMGFQGQGLSQSDALEITGEAENDVGQAGSED